VQKRWRREPAFASEACPFLDGEGSFMDGEGEEGDAVEDGVGGGQWS